MPAQIRNDHRVVFELPEVARMLGLSRETVRRAILRGELPAIRLGRKYLVRRDALADFLTAGKT